MKWFGDTPKAPGLSLSHMGKVQTAEQVAKRVAHYRGVKQSAAAVANRVASRRFNQIKQKKLVMTYGVISSRRHREKIRNAYITRNPTAV